MVKHHREGFEKENASLSLNPISDQLCDLEGVPVSLRIAAISHHVQNKILKAPSLSHSVITRTKLANVCENALKSTQNGE